MSGPTQVKANQVLLGSTITALLGMNVRDAIEFLFSTFPVLVGEVGAVNLRYPWGDLRRYGCTGLASDLVITAPGIGKLQNAIDSAKAIGVAILVPKPAEQYSCKGPFIIPSDTTWVGMGGHPKFRNVSAADGTDGNVHTFVMGTTAVQGYYETFAQDSLNAFVEGSRFVTVSTSSAPLFSYAVGMLVVIHTEKRDFDYEHSYFRYNRIIGMTGAGTLLDPLVLQLLYPNDQDCPANTRICPANGTPPQFYHNDTCGGRVYTAENVTMSGLDIGGPYGPFQNGNLHCHMEDMIISGLWVLGWNGAQRCSFNNVSGSFTHRAFEAAFNTYKTTVDDLVADYLFQPVGVEWGAGAPRFVGGCHLWNHAKDCELSNFHINIGDAVTAGGDVQSGAIGKSAINCRFENINVRIGTLRNYDGTPDTGVRPVGLIANGGYNVSSTTGDEGTKGCVIDGWKVKSLTTFYRYLFDANSYYGVSDPTTIIPDQSVELKNSRFDGPSNLDVGCSVLLEMPGWNVHDNYFAVGDIGVAQLARTLGTVKVYNNEIANNYVREINTPNGANPSRTSVDPRLTYSLARYGENLIANNMEVGTKTLKLAHRQIGRASPGFDVVAAAPYVAYTTVIPAGALRTGDAFLADILYSQIGLTYTSVRIRGTQPGSPSPTTFDILLYTDTGPYLTEHRCRFRLEFYGDGGSSSITADGVIERGQSPGANEQVQVFNEIISTFDWNKDLTLEVQLYHDGAAPGSGLYVVPFNGQFRFARRGETLY